jgi:hypothetical protein
MISLKTHNVLDYLIGGVLILCPYLFEFSDILAARNAFLVLGFGLIGYSLLTNYYYSIAKIISIRAHMFLDVVLGIALMLVPSFFGYRTLITGGQYALHFVLGLAAIVLVAITNRRTGPAISGERPELKKVA